MLYCLKKITTTSRAAWHTAKISCCVQRHKIELYLNVFLKCRVSSCCSEGPMYYSTTSFLRLQSTSGANVWGAEWSCNKHPPGHLQLWLLQNSWAVVSVNIETILLLFLLTLNLFSSTAIYRVWTGQGRIPVSLGPSLPLICQARTIQGSFPQGWRGDSLQHRRLREATPNICAGSTVHCGPLRTLRLAGSSNVTEASSVLVDVDF